MKTHLKLLVCSAVLLISAGCATLEVTAQKALVSGGEKQPVTLGVQASGDRLLEVLGTSDDSIIRGADGKLFDRVTLLPKESKFMQPQEMQSTYKVDYILAVGISDISVDANLNPYWFATLPLLFLNPFIKTYVPMVSFEPGVSLDFTLRDAASGKALMQKQVIESSSDHYSPTKPGPKVRKLVSMTINNAFVSIMQDSQKSIASARKGK